MTGQTEAVGSVGAAWSLSEFTLDLEGRQSGKVRESWPLPNGRRLIITSDRLSAFDRVIGLVPHKGQVLNQLAAWWFDQTRDLVANHLLAVPDPNAAIVVDAQALPVEVVVRARLTGSTSTSLLPLYEAGERRLYGIDLPDGLTPHGPLPVPLITPTTKAEAGGHDEPITAAEIVDGGLVDAELWARVERKALALFNRGCEVAASAGFVLADTKYEFGINPADGALMLIDEIHTPDSSRYWEASTLGERLAAGLPPEGYDKEAVRLALRAAGYKGDGPPPDLDAEVWTETSNRYVTLFERLTGTHFVPGSEPLDDRLRRNLSRWLP